MGLDEATVQAAIDATATRLVMVRDGYRPCIPDHLDQDGAYPFWSLDGDTLYYRACERGRLVLDRRTTSPDELLEWIFTDVTRDQAIDFELHHRRAGEDSRRQWFALWIELATKLSPDWGRHVREDVERTLRSAPYVDDRP